MFGSIIKEQLILCIFYARESFINLLSGAGKMTFFSHLHVHSEYSLMESTIKIKDLVNIASINGMKAVALADKYVMSGAIEFYKEAVRNNIKPIIGCEICVRNSGVLSHLILLVENIRGYGNLCRIVSKSHLEKKGLLPTVEFSSLRALASDSLQRK